MSHTMCSRVLSAGMALTLSCVIQHIHCQPAPGANAKGRPSREAIVARAFFAYQEALAKEIQRRTTLTHSDHYLRSAGRLMGGVSADGVAVVWRVATDTNAQIRDISAKQMAIANTHRAGRPSLATFSNLTQLEIRRAQIPVDAFRGLSSALSPEDWTALRAYVEQDFSKQIETWEVRAK